MALEDKKITKLYYSIGEVSKLFGVNNSLIRFWEKEFSIIKPKKTKKAIDTLQKKILTTSKSFFIW